ncbi:hypothetical protein NM208_g13933 [Fusarium decemcellulare]|uniref:Uncharacterized protein n=1 Tax=Fusarium decemcellulare TaxID=57161 RepID=A0ACC1RJU9_9HYPO|nr:hypothetical protein NM208_g13933 [Fusarium decemcellulare]
MGGCDEAQPKCGRCQKLGIACVGMGTRRFRFQEYKPKTGQNQLTPSPSRSPSNETTMTTSAFISLMGIDDERYDMKVYGPHFFAELPRRIGSNDALDASTSAVITAFTSVRLRKYDPNVLVQFGRALRALRTCLDDPKQPVTLKMEMVGMILLCQLWIDNKQANKHRGVIAYLLKETVAQGRLSDIPQSDIRVWCLQSVYASMVDPSVELESWFWDMAVQDAIVTRPYHYGPNLISLELGTIGELALYLRDPKRYVYQLQCHYDIVQKERPIVRKLLQKSIPKISGRDSSLESKRECIEHAAIYGILLGQSALMVPTLDALGVQSSFTKELHHICDEIILLAHLARPFRPCGASFVPELLKLAWPSLNDSYRHKEIEDLIEEYSEDVQGGNYLEQARDIRSRYDRLRRSREKSPSPVEDADGSPPCVIL